MSTEAEFLRQLRVTFRDEAQEHLQTITAGLLQLEAPGGAGAQEPVIELVFRAAHSLKGAARAVELRDVERLCQQLEDCFEGWRRNTSAPTRAALDDLHLVLDGMAALLGRPADAPAPPFAAVAPPTMASPPLAQEPTTAGLESVRVRVDLLDARLLEAEEMIAVKLAGRQRVEELRSLEQSVRAWRSGSIRSDGEAVRGFERQLTDMARRAEQDSEAASKLIDGLLASAKKLLLLPFSTIASNLPRLLRDLCAQLGKEADLELAGEHHEVDKRILDALKDPVIHLLRNAVDHGLETPHERLRSGKPARGRIRLAVLQVSGGRVRITLSDDGKGIDPDALKAMAVRNGLLTPADAAQLTRQDSVGLVFRSGLSTSGMITDLSGRGLGLAIVQEKARALGGDVTVQSQPGAGTTFEIQVPALRATFRGVLVEAAGRLLVVPTTAVERTCRVPAAAIRTLEGCDTWTLDGRVVPVAWLADVLELPQPGRTAAGAAMQLIVLGRGEQQVAFVVDRVVDEQEFLVKPLARPLSRVRHVASAALLPDGRIAFILRTGDLLLSARQRRGTTQAAPAAAAGEAKSILVAEDSITSRMLLQGVLESAGYRVTTAIDGLDAFSRLSAGNFDLVVSDVEMPRLNGFDLTARIRADRSLGELPVVLVTALEQRQHRERGVEVGANAYIVKSSFEQGRLVEIVRSLL